MAKVLVVNKDTNRKQWVPERWLDHPTLGKPFRKPRGKARYLPDGQRTDELPVDAQQGEDADDAAAETSTKTTKGDKG